jgi:uncharacterized protein YegP (UPF0339 family)
VKFRLLLHSLFSCQIIFQCYNKKVRSLINKYKHKNMFEIYKDKAGEFRFRLLAKNKEAIMASEGYKTKAACKNGIASVARNSQDKEMFEVKEAKNGKAHFVLKAKNNQVIGTSQMYTTKRGAGCGMRSVATNAKAGKIEDTTK